MTMHKRWAAALGAAIAALALAGCAAGTDISVLKPVGSETLPQKTFALARGGTGQAMTGAGAGSAKAVSDAVAQSLTAKGYTQTRNTARADLIVAIDIDGDVDASVGPGCVNTSATRITNTPYPVATPAGRARNRANRAEDAYLCRRHADGLVNVDVERTVLIDIQDRSTGEDLWRGRIKKTTGASEARDFADDISGDVEELLEDFPVSRGF